MMLALALFLVAAEADSAGTAQQSLGAMKTFIVDKLAYDAEYFEKVVRAKEQGRTLEGLSGGKWQAEVSRAQRNLLVLKRFLEERAAYDAGKPFSLPKDAVTFKEYRNLLALLNMFQAHAGGRSRDVIAVGDTLAVRSPDDFGRVRGARADYYVSMFRAYFYLMGSAHYAERQDQKAVSWFARLEADANLSELKKKIENVEQSAEETQALRLDTLRARPLAVLPLVNQTGDDALGYVGGSLAEVLAGDLVQSSDLVLVERSQIEKITDEVALALAGFTKPGAATQAGSMLGAGTLIVGSYTKDKGGLLMTVRLVETEKETVLAAQTANAKQETLFTDARKMILALLAQVGWDSGVSSEDLLARHAPRADTARKLFEARLLRATKSAEAKALYAQAMKEDPALANLYDDLKTQFADLSATLALLPFLHLTGHPDDAWMARGVVEALATDLPRLRFTVVERGRVDDVMLAAHGDTATFLDSREASETGRALNADYVVLGSVLHQAPSLRVDLRIVEVGTGVIAFSTSAENRRDDLAAAIVSLTTQIAERFNAPLSEKDIDQMMAAKMSKEEFEKAMRAQLAKDRLRPAEKSVAAEKSLEMSTIARWSAVGGALVGGGVAATGFIAAAPLADRASQLHGLQSVIVEPTTQAELRAQRDDAASQANLWTGVGYAGAGIAALGVGWLVADALFLGDEEEKEATAATAGGR